MQGTRDAGQGVCGQAKADIQAPLPIIGVQTIINNIGAQRLPIADKGRIRSAISQTGHQRNAQGMCPQFADHETGQRLIIGKLATLSPPQFPEKAQGAALWQLINFNRRPENIVQHGAGGCQQPHPILITHGPQQATRRLVIGNPFQIVQIPQTRWYDGQKLLRRGAIGFANGPANLCDKHTQPRPVGNLHIKGPGIRTLGQPAFQCGLANLCLASPTNPTDKRADHTR